MDDSIVRGNTTKAIVGMLREAGAREVHVRITSPPIRWPCFYGIDLPARAELVATDLLTHEVAGYIGADSLDYLSLEALVEAAAPAGATGSRGLCAACFTGDYPIPIPDPHGTAQPERTAAGSPTAVRPLLASTGSPMVGLGQAGRAVGNQEMRSQRQSC
jgi:glutamine phosphoribosylpyrophosphate amidotransferase